MFEDTVNAANPIAGRIAMSNLCSEILQVNTASERMRILFAFRRQSPQDNRVQILVSGRTPTLLQYPRGDSAVTFAVKSGSSASTSLLFAMREPILEY